MIFFTLVGVFLFSPKSYTQATAHERHIEVSMRMIGHQVLLNSGDSTSRVLPIEKEVGGYKIQFESEFQFDSEELVATIDSIVKQTKIATSYLVEVKEPETKKIIYSYEIGNTPKYNLIPCRERVQNQGGYQLFFTILDSNETNLEGAFMPPFAAELPPASSGKKLGNSFFNIWMMLPFLILTGLFFYFWKKEKSFPSEVPSQVSSKIDSDMISIGEYQFDKKNMELSYDNKKTELTSKETDLLFLLYTSANTILKRDNILRIVWGDEGDYVGRTLDVFISKLRKKLAADSNLKIVNIRGVGYKFVMNNG